ncbi:hypothetical protein OF001_U30211 [Pseudomonas sp. OF001]|nr:hypothetical protein OF001_U30211 [Pseudomonas sp. OF001]
MHRLVSFGSGFGENSIIINISNKNYFVIMELPVDIN